MKLHEVETNATLVEEGAWVGSIPEMGDLELRVRGLQSTAYRRMQQKLIEALPRQRKVGGRIEPEDQDRITGQCLAATILLDWRGLENADGSPMPYTREQASALCTEPRYRRFRDAVAWAASVVAEDRAEAEKADAGNSATS